MLLQENIVITISKWITNCTGMLYKYSKQIFLVRYPSELIENNLVHRVFIKWKYVLIKIFWMKIKLVWQSSLHNWNSYCCYYCTPGRNGVVVGGGGGRGGGGHSIKTSSYRQRKLTVHTLLRMLSKSCFRFRHRCAASLFCSRRHFCRSRSTPCERKKKKTYLWFFQFSNWHVLMRRLQPF